MPMKWLIFILEKKGREKAENETEFSWPYVVELYRPIIIIISRPLPVCDSLGQLEMNSNREK